MKRNLIILHLFFIITYSSFALNDERNIILDKTTQIEKILRDRNYEQLNNYIDENLGLFITDNIKMNSFYSIHLSKKMISNIRNDNKKLAFFIDDDPREPAWTTLVYFMEHRFCISKNSIKNIEFNNYYKKIDFDLTDSLIYAWNDSVFVEYCYFSPENESNLLSIYYIFLKIDGEFKLIGLTRDY